jgi:glycosyltransferase involved in cell wall biosynthesis
MNFLAKNGFDCYFMDSNHPAAEKHTEKPFKAQENLTVLPPGYDIREIDPDVLFYSYPPHIQLVDQFKPDTVLFVMYDYHGDEYLPSLKRSLDVADIVVAISKKLYNLAIKLGCKERKLLYIPNGVYYKDFIGKFKKPKVLKNMESPIIGYSGVISEKWTDIALLNEVAEHYTVVCTGAVFDGDLSDNIINLGHQSNEEFPAFVRSFDVGLLPFKVSKFSKCMDPLKYYQYCAAGIPTVSISIPAVMDSNLAYCTDEHFSEFIKLALNEHSKYRMTKRRKYARDHDWETVLKPLLEEL